MEESLLGHSEKEDYDMVIQSLQRPHLSTIHLFGAYLYSDHDTNSKGSGSDFACVAWHLV